MIRLRPSARPNRRSRLRLHLSVDRLEGRALMATAGQIDPTFGNHGLYTSTPSSATTLGLTAVTVGPDGSIYAAGMISPSDTPTLGVIKLTPTGQPDPTFGTDGEATIPVPTGSNASSLSAIEVTPSGQVIVGGQTTAPSLETVAIVALLNADGTLDASYGTGGEVLIPAGTSFGGTTFTAVGVGDLVAFQPDGSALIAGEEPGSGAGSTTIGAVVRLTPQGAADPTFGTDGLASFASLSYASAVTVQSDGKILAAGLGPASVADNNAIVRLDADGTVDPTLTSPANFAFPIVTQVFAEPDGQILVAGHTFPQFFSGPGGGVMEYGLLLQLNGDGSTAGQTVNFGNYQVPEIVGVQSNGEILYITSAQSGINRLTPSLGGDPSFGPTSTSGYVPAGQTLSVDDGAIGPDGSIIGVGTLSATNPTSTADAAVRLTQAPTKATPGDYTGDGISDIAIYLPAYGQFAITDSSGQTAGKIVPFGPAGPGQTIPAPGDYYGTGYDDIAAYLPAYGAYAIQDPTGKTAGTFLQFGIAGMGQTIPAPGDYYGTGQDDIAVYLVQSGVFAIQDPTGATSGKFFQFGIPGPGQSIPVPGDYYGTGQDDIAVYLAQSGVWAIQDPTGQTSGELIAFGAPGIGVSIPVPGDYDGSGKTELAVYIPILGELIYRPANGGPDVTIPFGTPGNGNTLPAPGDYDGSGKTEVAAYLPNIGVFAYHPASGGSDVYKAIGVAGPGQTIPVTTVVLSPFPGTGSGTVSSEAIEEPGILGEPDTLDFLPSATAKKSKPGDPPAEA
jgi:uncharacterized delta-60 repeat protein